MHQRFPHERLARTAHAGGFESGHQRIQLCNLQRKMGNAAFHADLDRSGIGRLDQLQNTTALFQQGQAQAALCDNGTIDGFKAKKCGIKIDRSLHVPGHDIDVGQTLNRIRVSPLPQEHGC